MIKYVLPLASLILSVGIASAHVEVTPTNAPLASHQEFSVQVPNEKDIPTTEVRLIIPEGIEQVMPNVKPGWLVTMKKNGDKVTEIVWSKGQIPADMRDVFVFSAKTPATKQQLIWKAYQTYADGTVVAWDAAEETGEDGSYSVTEVDDEHKPSSGNAASVSALALAVVAIAIANKKRKQSA